MVRSARELAGVPDKHPGLAEGIDPKFLHVHFLDRKVTPAQIATVDPSPFGPDTFDVDGRHIYVTYPNGSGRSKLTIEVFERAFGVTATGAQPEHRAGPDRLGARAITGVLTGPEEFRVRVYQSAESGICADMDTGRSGQTHMHDLKSLSMPDEQRFSAEQPLASLVAGAIDGQQAAWNALVERLQRVVWKSVNMMTYDHEVRDDAFAATWLRLAERLAHHS